MTRDFLLLLLAALLPLGTLAAGALRQGATNQGSPGPGRLCLRDSSVDLLRSETVRVETSGRHGVELDIWGPAGRFVYAEGENFADPWPEGERVAVRATARVTRHRRQGQISYLFYGPLTAYPDGRARPVVWISGAALTGGRADLDILARVRIGPPQDCVLHYDYSFEDGPIVDNTGSFADNAL